jgi:hypothetical protein
MQTRRRWHDLERAVIVGICALLVPLTTTSALAHEADGHPARIQHGTCDNLAGVAFQLTGVGATVTPDGTPVPERAPVGAHVAHPVQTSETTLQASLTQLTQDAHAIVVYESDEAMGHIIACGEVGGMLVAQMPGMIMPGDVLPIWLTGAEHSGVATLQADGTQVIVHLYLSDAAAPDDAHDAHDDPAPHATPHSG